jgi:polyisoprenoid-binding protein YceI
MGPMFGAAGLKQLELERNVRMEKRFWIVLGCVLLGALGCDYRTDVPDVDDIPEQVAGKGFDTSGMAKAVDKERINPVINIRFVGNHKGDDPKPRHGYFSMAEGEFFMPEGKFENLESIRMGIYLNTLMIDYTASGLDEESGKKLREHLAGPDFFNIKENPTAEFLSSSITLNEDGTGTVVGTLSMLGEKQEMTMPVTVTKEKTLEAKFQLDRTKFGMNFGLDNIAELIDVTVVLDGSKG